MLQGQVIVSSAIHSKIPEQQDSERRQREYIYHGEMLKEKSSYCEMQNVIDAHEMSKVY